MNEAAGDESGRDDWSTPQDVVVPSRRPWWLASRGLASAIALTAVWSGLFIVRVSLVVSDPTGFSIAVAALNGVLAILYVPSIVHFARLRRGGATKSAVEDSGAAET